MATNQVTLTFAGDSKQLERSLDRVGASTRQFSDGVDRTSKRASTGFRQIGVAAAAAGVAVGAMALKFGTDSVKAFVEAEQAQTKLEDAFARFPALANTNIESLRALNTELAKKTRFDDDALASGQAVLAQFKLSGTQIEKLTPLVADYAAKTGKDLPTAAETLGKAFLGNTKALKELGINYKSTGDQAKDTAAITKLLADRVGGFAEKEGATAAGKAAILSNRFGEVKETIGAKLLPVLMKLSDVGLAVVGFIEKNASVLTPLAIVIGVVTAAQIAWNIAMSANPIGLIIIGIAALVTAIVWVATKTRFFQTIWNTAWGGIKKAAVAVWDWLKDLPGKIGRTFVSIAEFIGRPFRAAFNMVANAWNSTVGKLRFTVPGWVPVIGGNTIAAPTLPTFKMHTGGKVPGAPGTEVMAILQAGERVLPAGSNGGSLGPDDLRTVEGAGFDRVMLTYLEGLMRRNNLRLVRA